MTTLSEETSPVTGDPPEHRGEAGPAAENLIGTVLAGRYRIEQRLGRGTTGSVYRATHVKFGRTFAVKVLHHASKADAKLVRRFDREAELGGKVRHTNVISVIDVGETPDGARFMVMDLASGDNLAAVMLAQAPMPGERVLHLLRELCRGLHHAHERGVIHRDFKPENIIVERGDQDEEIPRIVDFGIAIARQEAEEPESPDRLTTTGLVLGTPHYMAPEQATGFAIDHRVDLFALGVIAYELLSGALPFDGTGVEVARANIMVPTPRMADRAPGVLVDPLLEAFTRRLMDKDPARRPATANAARELLDLIERDPLAAASALGIVVASPRASAAVLPTAPELPAVPVELPAPAPAPEPEPPRRPRAVPIAIGLTLVALAGVVLWIATRPPVAPRVAPPVAAIPAASAAASVPAPPPPPPVPPAAIVAPIAHPGPRLRTVDPRVALSKPAPVAPTAPAGAPPAATDAAAVAALYAEVGRELQRASTTHSPDATEALSIRFRRIRLADALATPDARRAAAAELAAVRGSIHELDR